MISRDEAMPRRRLASNQNTSAWAQVILIARRDEKIPIHRKSGQPQQSHGLPAHEQIADAGGVELLQHFIHGPGLRGQVGQSAAESKASRIGFAWPAARTAKTQRAHLAGTDITAFPGCRRAPATRPAFATRHLALARPRMRLRPDRRPATIGDVPSRRSRAIRFARTAIRS